MGTCDSPKDPDKHESIRQEGYVCVGNDQSRHHTTRVMDHPDRVCTRGCLRERNALHHAWEVREPVLYKQELLSVLLSPLQPLQQKQHIPQTRLQLHDTSNTQGHQGMQWSNTPCCIRLECTTRMCMHAADMTVLHVHSCCCRCCV